MMPAGFVLGGLVLLLRRVRAIGRLLIWSLVGWASS